MLVVLDPGHGGADRHNRGPMGYVEADGVLSICWAAGERLRAAGVDVRFTRENDATVPLAARTALANRLGADLMVSVHSNALGAGSAQTRARGTETYVQQGSPMSIAAGLAIHAAVVSGCGIFDRGVRTRDLDDHRIYRLGDDPDQDVDYYYILREARVPAVLVEVEFHDHPDGERWLLEPTNLERAGRAIADGILAWGSAQGLIAAAAPWPDVPPGHWTAGELAEAKRLGIEAGRPDGTLGFGQPLTVEQGVAMAMRTYRAVIKAINEGR